MVCMRMHNGMRTPMGTDALVDRIALDGQALAAAVDRAGPTAAIPSCPGWTTSDLIGHVGQVHRWAATYVRDGRRAFGGGSSHRPAPPTDGRLGWFIAGLDLLVEALRSAPDDLDTWTFLPAGSPREFWARRQAHETAIHRVDAEVASGAPSGVPTAFALDGLTELIELLHGQPDGRLVADPPTTLRFIAADADRSWRMTVAADHRVVEPHPDPAATADCTITGAASDLYLFAWNRPPVGEITVHGRPEPLDLWRTLGRI